MNTLWKSWLCLSAFAIGFGASNPSAFAQKWEPYQFKGNERYEFKISWLQDEKKEVVYIMEMKDTGKKDENDEAILDVSFTVKGQMNKAEFSEGSLESIIDMHGLSLNIILFNPVYKFIFAEIDVKEGEKTNFAGMGVVKITGKEKIAGREGFVCQFLQKDDSDKEQLTMEWVIDPALGLPLRTKNFESGQLQSQCELVKYGN